MASMDNLHITYRPADEASAREFLQWQYEPPYDIYNCPPADLEEALQYNIDPKNNVYAMFDQNDALVAYCSYGEDAQVPGGDYSEDALDIGLMVKPELTGQGLGEAFTGEVIRNGVERYAPKKLRVTIAVFNKRAIHTWEKNGFQQTQMFKRRSRDGMEFIVMTKMT
jgi:ribosomal-protein-alanine N-acetyltransferase